MNISALPEGCLSHILSLTSPVDVIRSSMVSKQFLSASDSDAVWDKFLPSDFNEIISHSSTPLQFGSKKELVLHLCTSYILVENDSKSFALDKYNGKKCYMLGARALEIAWGDNSEYWTWTSMPESRSLSRFPEVADLQSVCWLDIKGKICAKALTPCTTYGVYFVYMLSAENNFGFENVIVKVCVSDTNEDGLSRDHQRSPIVKRFYLEEVELDEEMEDDVDFEHIREEGELPVERGDGWMEIEMGKYQVDIDCLEEEVVLEMTLREVESLIWKTGLVVHGIELRPLD